MKLIDLIKSFFVGGKPPAIPEYILVERELSEELVVTGVKITSGDLAGLIFTVAPSVKFVKQDDGTVKLSYTYNIERMSATPAEHKVIDKTVGDIILDIIHKNHIDQENANRESDSSNTSQGQGVRQES